MGKCVLLECVKILLEQREMHKRVSKFVKNGDETGKIHLACHLEIEEVTVNVDFPLHKVVVTDGCIKVIHFITSSPIAINGVVEVELAFEVIKIETSQVGHDIGTDFRDGVVLNQFQGTQVGMVDHRLKIGNRVFLVVEVNQSVEVKV